MAIEIILTSVFSNVPLILIHLLTDMSLKFAGREHQNSPPVSPWKVRTKICQVHGKLNNANKNVSWNCHRPNSPMAKEMGS